MKMFSLFCLLLASISLQADTQPFFPVNGPVPAGLGTFSVTYSPSGKFAAATNNGSNSVSLFRVRHKIGAFVPFDTVPVGPDPTFAAFSPDERFAAVANSDNGGPLGSISVFKIREKSGIWVPIQIVDTAFPYDLTYSPNGKFLAVTNSDNLSSFISIYKVLQSGEIALVQTLSNPLVPEELTYSHDGKFLAVTNFNGNSVSIYKVNQSTGVITEIPGSPFPVGFEPEGVAYQHDGLFIAITNFGDNTVTIYRVNRETGALSNPQTISSGNTQPGVVSFSKNDKLAAVGSFANPGNAVVFCVHNGIWNTIPSQILLDQVQSPDCVDFSPCQDFAALSFFGNGASPGGVQLYEVEESACNDNSSHSSSSSSWGCSHKTSHHK